MAHYVNAFHHPNHGLLYYVRDAEDGIAYWSPCVAHATIFPTPVRKYSCSVLGITLSKKRLQFISSYVDMKTQQSSWPWLNTNDDRKTRAAHYKHIEEIKALAPIRTRQTRDHKLYVSIESLTGKVLATSNPLIAREMWGEQVTEGTLIRAFKKDAQ